VIEVLYYDTFRDKQVDLAKIAWQILTWQKSKARFFSFFLNPAEKSTRVVASRCRGHDASGLGLDPMEQQHTRTLLG